MNYNYSNTIDPLLTWFYANARKLVWRSNPTPYFVWISEIMLQQTRVEAVKAYFDRFIKELPDVTALASVDDDKLMKLWEGLGYYSRARNLKKAAQVIMIDYNGQIPANYKALLSLPGIGSYTAGAIGSIAFHMPEPAVDGNVLRVLKRVAGSYDDITKASVKKELENDLREIMPLECPGDYNQSLMELGALVCIPNGKPLCDQCPLREMCQAYQLGIQMELPVKPAKKSRKIEEKTILLIEHNNEYAIRKRDSKGLLAGLWELPQLEGKLTDSELGTFLEGLGFKDYRIESLGEAKHIFSHIEWHMVGYSIHIEGPQGHTRISEEGNLYLSMNNSDISASMVIENDNNDNRYTWASKNTIDKKYSLPTAFKSYSIFMK